LDGLRKFGERGGEAVLGIDLDTEFVVTAAEVLDKGMSGADHPRPA